MPNISDFDLPNFATAKVLAAQARATAANYAAIPGQLDIIRQTAAGGSVIGQMITASDTGTTYRVDAQPAFGVVGTAVNYTLAAVTTEARVQSLLTPINATQTSNTSRIGVLESGQASAGIAYDIQANLYANLAPVAGAVGYVTNDSTPAKNGIYRKVGATGTGSWAQGVDRTTAVENRATALEQGAGAIAPELASVAPTATLLYSSGVAYAAGQANYLGYRTAVGSVPAGSRRCLVYLNFATAPTKLTARLYNGGTGGSIVVTLPPTVMPTTVGAMIPVTFDSLTPFGAGDTLEVLSDAKFQFQRTTVLASGTQPAAMIATGGSYEVPGWFSTLAQTWYAEFYSLDDTNRIVTLTAKLKAGYRADLTPEITAANRADTYQAVTTRRDYAYTTTYATVADVDSVVGLNNSGSLSYYGGGSQIGTPQNFNLIELSAVCDRPIDAPVTLGRFLVYDTNYGGTLLADVTQVITPPTGVRAKERFTIPIYLPATIVNASANQIFVMPIFNGGVALQITPAVLTNTAVSQLIVGGTLTAPVRALSGSLATSFTLSCRTGTYDATKPKGAPQPSFADTLTDYPVIVLPPMIYGVVGRELCVYFSNIVRSPLPWYCYTYDVTTSAGNGVGAQYEDGYRWTPASVGDTPFTLDIYLGDTLLTTLSSTMRVTAANGPTVTRKLLQIGDSITEQGYWFAELMRLSALDTGYHLTLTGTRTTGAGGGRTVNVASLPDSTGTERVTTAEGWSGKSVSYHYSDPNSNFTFGPGPTFDPTGTIFNFAQYLAVNPSVTLASGDWVTFSLGTNDIYSMTRDTQSGTNVQTRMNTYFAQLEAMITSIQAAVPGIRVGIVTIIPPAHSQDSFAIAGNGTGLYRNRHKRSVTMWNQRVISQFGGRTGGNIYVLPVNHAIDTINGMSDVVQPASSRITRNVTRQDNNLHPVPIPAATATNRPGEGVWQMSDALWAALKSIG